MKTIKRSRAITWLLGMFISGLVVVVPPGYFYITYSYTAGNLASEAEINARIISQIISLHPELWEFERSRIEEYLSHRPTDGIAETRRVFNSKGELIAESINELKPPIVTESSVLMDSGVAAGRIEISRSLRPLMEQTGLVGLFVALSGLGAYAILRALMLHTLDRAQNMVKRNEARYSAVVEDIPMMLCRFLFDGTLSFVNNAYCRFLGKSSDELLGHPFEVPVLEEGQRVTPTELRALTADNPTVNYELRVHEENGEARWQRWIIRAIFQQGRQIEFQAIGEDISQRKQVEGALQASEKELRHERALLRALIDSIPDLIFFKDVNSVYLGCNKAFEVYSDLPERELIGKTDLEIAPREVADFFRRMDREMLSSGKSSRNEEWIPFKEGGGGFFDTVKTPYCGPDDELLGLIGVSRDITERKRAEEKLRESEEKFRLAFQTSPDSISFNRLSDGKYLDINEGFVELSGYEREEVIGKTSLEINIWDDPQDKERLVEAIKRTGFAKNMEARFRRKDGRILTGLASARILRLNREDVVLTITRDITQREAAEQEKAKLETQLFHSQKLESVGRLAGGVAHDFNNMLGVIIGHTDLALDQANPDDPLYLELEEIQSAAYRSADLTRQLLAFARRQTASPKVLDLNETIPATLKMLRRLIGEDISLTWMPGPELRRVKIDPAQVDQILANLVVNARDAIQYAGSVTLSTENVLLDASHNANQEGFAAGRYVLLTVSDTGSGMDEDVLRHIFEPFFTTKGVGQGTGLGLSMVYGIIRQNNGFMEVSSTPGKGTTFRIYLPGLEDTATRAPSAKALEKPRRGAETLLVVEDDEKMLYLTQKMLERLGYKVYTASSPARAIRMVEQYETIDLLIADVVMPEMNGRELVKRLRAIRPNLKFMHISGYTADAIARRGVLDQGIIFLQKPFSLKAISQKNSRSPGRLKSESRGPTGGHPSPRRRPKRSPGRKPASSRRDERAPQSPVVPAGRGGRVSGPFPQGFERETYRNSRR